MSATVSTDFLLLVAQATPEQQAAIERFIKGDSAALGITGGETCTRFLFRRAGSHWRVAFDGGPEFHLEDTLGARYLNYLLHHPNETISAFDLEVAIQPEKAEARSRSSIQEVADPDAARAYLRELTRVRKERDDAAEAGRLAEVERMDDDIAALEAALRGDCRAGDTGERARSNVNKALAAVRRRLAKGGRAERAFVEHVQRFVSVGYECMYAQGSELGWG